MTLAPRIVLLVVLPVGCSPKGGAEEHHGERAAEEHGAEGKGEHGEGLVRLTAEQLATAKIATGKVEKRTNAGVIQATAQIEPAAERHARVGTRIAGRIVTLKKGLGEPVHKGDGLVTVDSPELGQAKADYLGAVAGASVARETADREKALYEKKISSEKDWREAEATAVKAQAAREAAEARLHALGIEGMPQKVHGHYSSTLTISSPIDGLVVERNATQGQMVEPSDTLFVIMDLREVWIVLDVYERDLAQVKVGQTVRVKVAAYAGKEFTGSIQNVGAIIEPKTRAVKVRVVLDNVAGELKPGMFATVEIEGTTGEAHTGLYAPSGAIQRDGKDSIVFVPKDAQSFEVREVKVGRTIGDWVEIDEGLSEGETLVTNGAFLLKAELKKEQLGEGDSH